MSTHNRRTVLAVLFGTLLLDTIGFGMVFPIIPILFTDPSSPSFMLMGYSQSAQLFLAGLITALFGLTQFLAAPILGELSDVYGRKRLLLIGIAVLALSQLLFGFGIAIASLPLLFIARIIAGFAAANISIAQATIADVTPPEDRAKNFGLIGAAFGMGFIIGPLLSGWIAGVTGNPAIAFWLASILGLLNVVFVSLFLRETHHARAEAKAFTLWRGIINIRAALSDHDARPLYLASFLYLCGFAFFTSFVGILLVNTYGYSEAEVGTFFAIVGVCIMITQLFILRVLTKVYSERQILRYSILCAALIVALYPFAPTPALVYVFIPLLAVPQGLTMANLPALISKGVSAGKQGAALGINSSLMALASGVIPLVAGVSTGLVGLAASFVGGGLLMVVSWAVLFAFPRHSQTAA
jgi:MFS transporter, DHA1 family, tetracycline resistance protein